MPESNEKVFDSLEKISQKLDTSFVPEENVQETSLTLLNTFESLTRQKNEVIALKTTGVEIFEDQVELREGLKNMIIKTELVMEKLEADIRIGTKAYSHKVYGELVKTLTEAYKELRELDQAIFKAKMDLNKINSVKDIPDGGKITMNASQLLDLVNKARDNSTMTAIDATFTVEDRK